jgi:hypothetical protein
MGLLIFVFARVSSGRRGAILAEFAAVPNDQLPVSPETRAADSSSDVRPAPGHPSPVVVEKVAEVGGPKGPEPTRFGDWERNGRCVDF